MTDTQTQAQAYALGKVVQAAEVRSARIESLRAVAALSVLVGHVRHPLALAGLFLAASPDTLTIGGAQSFSVKFAEVRPTLGFVLMIAGMAIAFARGRAAEPGRLLARMT